MHNLINFRISSFSKNISFVFLLGSLCVLFHHDLSNAEEPQLNEIKQAGLSWGRKYFFDAPRFKDKNIQELLDDAIEEKLNTYGIKIIGGNSNNNYVLNYTIVLEESATQSEIDDLYEHDPELKDLSDGDSNYEHGRFIISIRNRDTREAIWGNNIEGIANLDLTEDVRLQRIKNLVEQTFENFPDNLNNIKN